MRTLILIAALLLSSTALAQNYYYNDYGYRDIQPSTAQDVPKTRIDNSFMERELRRVDLELEIRSHHRRMDLMNGGDGSGYYDRRYRETR